MAAKERCALGADQEVAHLKGTEHMVLHSIKIERSLNVLLESVCHEAGQNRSEVVRSCIRFALKSEEFLKKNKLALNEGDRLLLENLGDTSVTVRTLVRRLCRCADVIMEHPSAAWLSVVRLKCPEEQH